VEAQNNLKFLESIREPCENLSKAEPREIVAVLPDLLARIRIIWTLSRFYNTEDRLTGLLRKISNEIINRCRYAPHHRAQCVCSQCTLLANARSPTRY
jgi:dynein heavy chain, axonemal